MKGVIIAAGLGSRLWDVSNQVPKTLLPFGHGTILSAIVGRLKQAGITELAMVVGFNQHYIREYVAAHPLELPVVFIENTEWERGNGLSVYKVRSWVGQAPFLLSMSDHLVQPEAITRVVSHPTRANLLLVDPFIDTVFDLDDATKVQTDGERIVKIGKELPHYNALDCGIFRLESDYFAAMETALGKGRESISAAIEELVPTGRILAVSAPQAGMWMDLDTPEAYEFATRKLNAD